jgi:two-component system sensor histidine kinase DegS
MAGDEHSFEAFLEEVRKDYERTHQEIKEIDVLINQSTAEVERSAQANAQMTNRVRQLDTNFETLPREYIRETFEELLNVQQRLYTMRGQLETLQSKQRNLEQLLELQRGLSEFVGGSAWLPKENSGGNRDPNDESTVIRVIQTEEAEKENLVRKMHDGPASSLSNFILQAEICQRFFDVNPDRARTELNTLKSSAAATFSYVKDFIFDLRPMMLTDLGVVPTLRRYVESAQEKSGISVSITITGLERRLENHIEVTIFRGVQNLLTNALAHSQATQIQVLLDIAHEHVTAVVEDNGNGFNPDEAFSNNNRTIGLPTLRERIEMLGGSLNIQSSLGQGTRAEFTIPIETEVVEIY